MIDQIDHAIPGEDVTMASIAAWHYTVKQIDPLRSNGNSGYPRSLYAERGYDGNQSVVHNGGMAPETDGAGERSLHVGNSDSLISDTFRIESDRSRAGASSTSSPEL